MLADFILQTLRGSQTLAPWSAAEVCECAVLHGKAKSIAEVRHALFELVRLDIVVSLGDGMWCAKAAAVEPAKEDRQRKLFVD